MTHFQPSGKWLEASVTCSGRIWVGPRGRARSDEAGKETTGGHRYANKIPQTLAAYNKRFVYGVAESTNG